jgi:hypothetical protein
MPLLTLAITDDASRSALLSTHLIRGQQCAEAPLDPGGATKQLPARRYLALEGGLTDESAWAAERRRRRPQEHGWGSQRAVARRGGPGGPDAGRGFVRLSTSSASVRCPVSGASGQCPRLSVHGTGVQCPVRASERPGVRCPVWASGVCGLPRPLCPAEVRSGSAAVGRQPDGWDGRGRRGRPLRPCPARGLPEGEPRARSWPRRCWASRGVGLDLAVVVGGGWAVASSIVWPTRRDRVHARIVRW